MNKKTLLRYIQQENKTKPYITKQNKDLQSETRKLPV